MPIDMMPNSIPLTDHEFESLPEQHQDILKAFFLEADALIENPEALQKDFDGNHFIPPESLQTKHDSIVAFGGDKYCPFQQRTEFFSFSKTNETVH